jgi:hypothetical protein
MKFHLRLLISTFSPLLLLPTPLSSSPSPLFPSLLSTLNTVSGVRLTSLHTSVQFTLLHYTPLHFISHSYFSLIFYLYFSLCNFVSLSHSAIQSTDFDITDFLISFTCYTVRKVLFLDNIVVVQRQRCLPTMYTNSTYIRADCYRDLELFCQQISHLQILHLRKCYGYCS